MEATKEEKTQPTEAPKLVVTKFPAQTPMSGTITGTADINVPGITFAKLPEQPPKPETANAVVTDGEQPKPPPKPRPPSTVPTVDGKIPALEQKLQELELEKQRLASVVKEVHATPAQIAGEKAHMIGKMRAEEVKRANEDPRKQDAGMKMLKEVAQVELDEHAIQLATILNAYRGLYEKKLANKGFRFQKLYQPKDGPSYLENELRTVQLLLTMDRAPQLAVNMILTLAGLLEYIGPKLNEMLDTDKLDPKGLARDVKELFQDPEFRQDIEELSIKYSYLFMRPVEWRVAEPLVKALFLRCYLNSEAGKEEMKKHAPEVTKGL